MSAKTTRGSLREQAEVLRDVLLEVREAPGIMSVGKIFEQTYGDVAFWFVVSSQRATTYVEVAAGGRIRVVGNAEWQGRRGRSEFEARIVEDVRHAIRAAGLGEWLDSPQRMEVEQ
jgi:hypothetical protein